MIPPIVQNQVPYTADGFSGNGVPATISPKLKRSKVRDTHCFFNDKSARATRSIMAIVQNGKANLVRKAKGIPTTVIPIIPSNAIIPKHTV